MAAVVTGDLRRAARLAEAEPSSLLVVIGAPRAPGPFAQIRVVVGGKPLADKLTRAMASAVREVARAELPSVRVVRIRSDRALARLELELEGSIAVVPVTAKNMRRLGALVEALWARGVLGIQLVWDGREPERAVAEPHVFAALERARAMGGQAPVVLARDEQPVEPLRILMAARTQKGQGQL
jgi:hypothetical protein